MGTRPKRLFAAAAASTLAISVGLSGNALASPRTAQPAHTLPGNAHLYIPQPDQGAVQQVVDLLRHRDVKDAALIAHMALTPQAVWFTIRRPTRP